MWFDDYEQQIEEEQRYYYLKEMEEYHKYQAMMAEYERIDTELRDTIHCIELCLIWLHDNT